MNISQRFLPRSLAAAMVLALGSTAAQAADVYLRAAAFQKTLPNGTGTTSVTMWGYQTCNSSFGACSATASPGAAITVPAGDASLTIHLLNNLSQATSVLIPGQFKPLSPVKFTDADSRERVRSFDAETAPGATGTYTWSNLRPGTYLYQSGTHPQLQVQMGLYGALVKNASDAPGATAYGGVPFDQAALLVFSEIDPALHNPQPRAANASKDGYAPRFFLINGVPFTSTSAPVVTAAAGNRVLLRLVNAGIENHAPQLLGGYFDIVAEDGNPAAIQHRQYNTLLPAAKTLDVVFTPTADGLYPLFDRRLRLVNDRAMGGGMLARIAVGAVVPPPPPPPPPPAGAPTAFPDAFFILTNNINIPADPAGFSNNFNSPGVLANDTDPNGDVLRVAPGSVTALQGASGALLNVDTGTGGNRGRVRFRAPTSNWVGDAFFSYVAREAATAAQLSSAPADAHIVHDMHLTTILFHDPSGTASDAWDLAGELRGLPAATTITISFVQNTGNTDCTRVGEVIGTVNVPASANPSSWTFTRQMPRAVGCNRIRVEAPIASANGVPAHTATLDNNYQRVNP